MHVLERQANLDKNKHDFFLAERSLPGPSLEKGVQIPALHRGLKDVVSADLKVVRRYCFGGASPPTRSHPFQPPSSRTSQYSMTMF